MNYLHMYITYVLSVESKMPNDVGQLYEDLLRAVYYGATGDKISIDERRAQLNSLLPADVREEVEARLEPIFAQAAVDAVVRQAEKLASDITGAAARKKREAAEVRRAPEKVRQLRDELRYWTRVERTGEADWNARR